MTHQRTMSILVFSAALVIAGHGVLGQNTGPKVSPAPALSPADEMKTLPGA